MVVQIQIMQFDENANLDDGSRQELIVYGCTDDVDLVVWNLFKYCCIWLCVTINNYNPAANVDDGSCDSEIFGCTDPCSIKP